MDRLTQKERAQLEEVFAAIYANRGSKFKNIYEWSHKKIVIFFDKMKNGVNKNINLKNLVFRSK
ncbi:hypothetical protein [Campylobacter sp. CCUG 57310]|uniref:hypothetical protein n=1 Tax=Campylobacter sp. CCUG 57310 TaxID=2517362 RepID=UPI001563C564|nr:hypothetical protein [Campylobacter sp. CCUG 57310]QKF92416.1 hypothetical protein CORI_1228 [Campylobacter sp. CCUG 57310]